MTEAELEYTGIDVLEALQEARNYNRYLTKLVTKYAGGARCLLDFGAGIGTFGDLVRQEGFEVRCVEADEGLARRLRNKGFETISNLEVLPDSSFDFIFSLNVFEHIENDEEVMRTLANKLREGGRLLVYVPALESLWTSLDDRVQHFRRYTAASLRTLVTTAGLEPTECRYADSLGFLAAWVFKIFGNREGKLSPHGIRFYDRLVMPLSIALDTVSRGFVGKNVYLLSTKPARADARPGNLEEKR